MKKQRERERLRQRQDETRLGLLTQLGRSMVRDHPGVKFSPFFFFTSLVSDWYSPYLGCIPGISKLYRNKNNDFFSPNTLRYGRIGIPPVSVSDTYRIPIQWHFCHSGASEVGVFQTSNHYIFKPQARRILGCLECSIRKGRPSPPPSICATLCNSESEHPLPSEQLSLWLWVNVDVGELQDGSISLNLME